MKKGLLTAGAIIGAFCAIILLANAKDGIKTIRPIVDLYAENTDITELSTSQAVEAEIYMTLDYFATETTTRTRDGNVVSRDNDYYFIIPAFSGDDAYFIGIRVDGSDYSTFSSISDETYDYLMGYADDFGMTTTTTEGGLAKLDDEMYQYMVEWFEEAQWFENDADIDKYVLPLYIDPFRVNLVRTMFIIGVLGTILGVVCLILLIMANKKEKTQAKEQTVVVIAGMSYPKATFSRVNQFLAQRETVFAMQELRNITGIGPEEAKEVLDHWSNYYL